MDLVSRIHAVETNPNPDPLPFTKGEGTSGGTVSGSPNSEPKRVRTSSPRSERGMCLAWSQRGDGGGLQSAGVRVSTEALRFCGRVGAVLTVLRDKSRAPAAIRVGALTVLYP